MTNISTEILTINSSHTDSDSSFNIIILLIIRKGTFINLIYIAETLATNNLKLKLNLQKQFMQSFSLT